MVTRLDLPERWPGQLHGQFEIVVRGDHAFVPSFDLGFYVVSIADIDSPIVVGATNRPGSGRCVALYGDYAYVAGTPYVPGYVVDISVVQDPHVVDSFTFLDGGLFEAQVLGSLMYAASGHVYVVDLTIPLKPAVMDTFPFVGSCLDFDVQGARVHVIDNFYRSALRGMGSYDISNPASPEFLGKLMNGGDDVAITARNDRAWVLNSPAGLYAVNISDPTQPTMITCYATGTAAPCLYPITAISAAFDVILHDQYAFVSAGWSGLLAYTLQARSDVNADGVPNSTDIIVLVNHVFKSGAPPASPTQADTNCSEDLTAADVIILVNYVFKGSDVPLCP